MTKVLLSICLIFVVCFSLPAVSAGEQEKRFVDVDGDGFADNLPDTDFDGIPDNVDPDRALVSDMTSTADARISPHERTSLNNRFQRMYQFRRKLALQTDGRVFRQSYFRSRTDSFEFRTDPLSRDRFRRLRTR